MKHFFSLLNLKKILGVQEGEKYLCALKCTAKSGLALKLESGVSLTANYVVCNKNQTVTDSRESWSYMEPNSQVTLGDAAMKLYMVQSSCSVNLRGAEIKRAANKGTKHNKIIF